MGMGRCISMGLMLGRLGEFFISSWVEDGIWW